MEGVFALSKKRLCFSKLGMGKFISHLDLMRTFTRTVMRAGLPVRYTQGFNPHQIMTFALPLPIGVTGGAEFVDIDFEDTVSHDEIMNKLNENLPPDIRILRVSEPVHKASEITAARYEILLYSENIGTECVKEFFAQSEIYIIRKTKKKGEQSVNLLSFIRSVEVKEGENCTELCIIADAGGERNLKPTLITEALESYAAPKEFDSVKIHRTDIFLENGEKFENFC